MNTNIPKHVTFNGRTYEVTSFFHGFNGPWLRLWRDGHTLQWINLAECAAA